MSDKNRTYRSSQLISPFGPGSIVEIGDESLILVDPSKWPKKLQEIKLERLTKSLGLWTLKKPPLIANRYEKVSSYNSLMTVRFPMWMFCQCCRRMERWTSTNGKVNCDGLPVCSYVKCKEKVLVPMRFVAACNKGHLQDVPWVFWAHKGERVCEHPELYFKSDPSKGSGLGALYIECQNPQCGAKNDLGKIMNKDALSGVKCEDKQPWDYNERGQRTCEETLVVLQRGASNLYYPIVLSALDIPYDEQRSGNPIYDLINHSNDFELLKAAIKGNKPKRVEIYAEDLADEFGVTKEEVIEAATGSKQESRTFKIPESDELREAEWDVLVSDHIEEKETETFKAKVANMPKESLYGFGRYIKRVVLIDKLREVRAFCGFERVTPDGNSIYPDTAREVTSWVPATEVYGEGIFIEFNQSVLRDWENSMGDVVKSRHKQLTANFANTSTTYLPEPTIKFLILHTLAHLMIRQLSFESGYSSGSLRERIFASDEQAGVMIYTADGDSEGSLGGLVQQGEINRLIPALIAALETAAWCSNDPVCSEMESQGVMGLNKSACHSCTLVSETSCENNNLLLDRKLLIGDDTTQGFFSELMEKLAEEEL